jgi:hypothetical protein
MKKYMKKYISDLRCINLSVLTKLTFCWKIAFLVINNIIAIIAVGDVLDKLLESANQEKIFLPFMGKVIKLFILLIRSFYK